MRGHIVIVEDDYLQDGLVETYLQDALPDVAVTTIATESEFRERMPGLRKAAPDVVIMDAMLPWASLESRVPKPPEVQADGYFRAGLRCAKLMSEDAQLSAVPVIIYTILERSDLAGDVLPENSTYMRKSADLNFLARKVREVSRLGGKVQPAAG